MKNNSTTATKEVAKYFQKLLENIQNSDDNIKSILDESNITEQGKIMIQTTHNKLQFELLLAKHEITDLESKQDRLLEEFEDTLYELERKKEQNLLLEVDNKKLSNMITEIGDTAKKIEKIFDESNKDRRNKLPLCKQRSINLL